MKTHRSPSPSPAAAPLVPPALIPLLAGFRFLFTAPVWDHVLVLVAGAILAPGKRTVSAALRVMGLGSAAGFARYHHVLSQARWSSRAVACKLVGMILEAFLPNGPVVIGMDDTIERRWGQKIAARGIYRDPVRSTHGHFVKASGLRWLSLMVMVPIPFVRRRWALPFLTVLAPSQRWSTEHARRHKKLTDWARQAILQTRRWLANRTIVIVADSSFAALELIASVRQHVCFVTRLRLDANLFEPPPRRRSGRRGRPRKKGCQLPKLSKILTSSATRWTKIVMSQWYGDQRCSLSIVTGTALWYHTGLPPVAIRWVLVRDPSGEREPQAFLCTNLNATPVQILGWFVQRWSMETTLQETREHLGVETQRQWSDLAILRTTPALLGLFSLITIWANTSSKLSQSIRPRDAAWYAKSELTFSDAIAAVRRVLWAHPNISMSGKPRDMVEIPRPLFDRFTQTLCYAT